MTSIQNLGNFPTNLFSYNALDARVSKTDSGGTRTYIRDGEDPTDPVLNDGSYSYVPGISIHSSGGTRVYHGDFQGTNRAETDSAQNIKATRSYDAFGGSSSITGSPAGPFGYAGGFGYQEDNDSGLKLLGHRFYDPSIGRFITRDPAQSGGNWFAYAGNSPTNALDPSGLKFDSAGAVLGLLGSILWQLPQEALGLLGSVQVHPEMGYDEESDSVIVYNSWLTRFFGGDYVTLGHFILCPGSKSPDEKLAHERGHRPQSAVMGPMFIPATIAGYVVGADRTLLWKGTISIRELHDASPLEMDADGRSGRIEIIQDNWAIKMFWLTGQQGPDSHNLGELADRWLKQGNPSGG